jgi:TnpA family transposase
MSQITDTAYPIIKSNLSAIELEALFMPSADEIAEASRLRGMDTRLGYLVTLKTLQRLGYVARMEDVPDMLLSFLYRHLSSPRKHPSRTALKVYERSDKRMRHLTEMRQRLDIRPFTPKDHPWLISVAEQHAETKELVTDIINVMLEELVHHRFELPGFATLDRIAANARKTINDRFFRSIVDQLTKSDKAHINDMLSRKRQDPTSVWQTLKREPKKPTNKETRSYLQHVRWLQTLGANLPAPNIPISKLKQFTLEARAANAAEMAKLRPDKRYALAVILIHSQHSKALDDVVDIFVRIMRKLERSAQDQLQHYLLEHQKRVDQLISQFRDVLAGYQSSETQKAKANAIPAVIGVEVDEVIAQCDEHLAYAGNNYIPFMLKSFQQQRSLLINCLQILDLQSTTDDHSTLTLIELLKSLANSHKAYLTTDAIAQLTGESFGQGWMPERWRQMIHIVDPASGKPLIHRKYLELCILTLIKQELTSGDLFVVNSAIYDDFREQLVDDDTLEEELEQYGNYVGLPLLNAKEFVIHLKPWLVDTAKQVDEAFPENAHVEIVEGRISIKKGPSVSKPDMTVLDNALREQLPSTNLVDILTETEKWLGLNKLFFPFSGNLPRIQEAEKRFVTTLFCYGCNLGPAQTARAFKDLSRKQIAWLDQKQISEDSIDKAITAVVNMYNKFELPQFWGTGKYASADGTKWDLYEQNLMSEYHIRYGGYGGIGYYHVADSYIALFSHFIPCGVYEAIYILDGLMKNESDIQPTTLHGDTQAQSYPVFGLAYLLGIDLMPRMRNIRDLSLYRPDHRYRYKHLDGLFRKAIDFKLIEKHFKDMLRVAVSIKLGKISPSAILRRLGTYSRKNKLYFAIRELGYVVRTVFLLRYINELELRQTIQSATNKSEQFNDFVKWLFFGGEGIIAENMRHQQRKIVKYNQLVANMVILHNADTMTRVLQDLSAAGVQITPSLLEQLSPYWRNHINRFGDYRVNLLKSARPLHYSLQIFT